MIPVDIDVWLETERALEKIKVIPYVRTAEEMRINYHIDLVRSGGGGSTKISQSGAVTASAKSPGKMGTMTINAGHATGTCEVTIKLTSGGEKLGDYKFSCPS